MNTSNWTYYYKLSTDGTPCESNLLYVPLVNPQQDVMCMHYAINTEYQQYIDTVPQDVVDYFFEKELRLITRAQNLQCTPKVLDVDQANRKIFIEWNKETLSQIVNDKTRSLDTELPDWKDCIFNVLKELKDNEYWKVALYPHCFFLNKEGVLKTIDYYAVIPYEERYLERAVIEKIIGPGGAYRFDEATTDGIIDFKKFYDITMTRHLGNFWKDNPFPKFYERLHNEL